MKKLSFQAYFIFLVFTLPIALLIVHVIFKGFHFDPLVIKANTIAYAVYLTLLCIFSSTMKKLYTRKDQHESTATQKRLTSGHRLFFLYMTLFFFSWIVAQYLLVSVFSWSTIHFLGAMAAFVVGMGVLRLILPWFKGLSKIGC